MAAGDTQITIIGNLVDDPQLRYTPTGQAVASFRVASTPGSSTRTRTNGRTAIRCSCACNVWRPPPRRGCES